jgi:dTDP-4-dehydrorhamnose reductase
MKILITGANGMLCTAVREVFKEHDLFAYGKDKLDISHPYITEHSSDIKPDLIIHLAAITDHYASEMDWEDTYITNTIGTHNMVEVARKNDCPIVYISSCSEYTGTVPGKETDVLNPCNHYAISKYYGDLAVRSWHKHYILRSGWMMGGGPGIDKKFLAALIWPRILAGQKEIPAIMDSFGHPTYTYDLARTIKNMVGDDYDSRSHSAPYGTYNVGGLGMASRWELARAFVDYLGVDVKIIPMSYIEFHKQWPAKVHYHKDALMDLDKIEHSGFSAMRPWKEALKEYTDVFKGKSKEIPGN